jgi:PleD family two-component response regulator
MIMMFKALIQPDHMNFPFKAATPDSHTNRTADKPGLRNFHGARLLIVDDELAHRKVLKVMVEHAGMTCKMVPGAKEALYLLQSEPVDAVVADLDMPGVSGLELLSEVRHR